MKGKLPMLAAAYAAAWMTISGPAHAADLNGPWATAASVCNQVFIKKDGLISFRPDSDQYGGGFIMEGNKVRGQVQSCTIKARKEEGNIVHLLASCANDIMASSVQFSVRIIDDNTISRIFPGMSDDLSLKYSRCTM